MTVAMPTVGVMPEARVTAGDRSCRVREGNMIRVVIVVLLALFAATANAQAPRRVMSINLCTDQLALMLLPRERIASVSWLARDPALSAMAREAMAVPVNHGSSEEVLRARPDIVLAGTYTTRATVETLRALGAPLVEIAPTENWADIRRATREVGDALGERAKADAALARMDATLARLAAEAPAQRPLVAFWSGPGMAPGAGTLSDAVVEAAGARNLARELGIVGFGALDAERLIASSPDLLITAEATPAPSLRREAASHPAIRNRWRGRMISVPEALTSCGGPFTADAAVQLRAEMNRVGLNAARTAPNYPERRQ
ncbi:MAG: iron complex transport system substrate-binding protein [Alphaproteobacteria bacterium]|nr:MAG: iron complex transport system substrate-binding protein [Caulobacteraceae bacterium]TPW03620.1 MAG: iron complex transport system substrate-binding protein [Alphaproteobacteria bacterium]